jgi:uncharacterized pyridoxal phosphate-containing UPF0001 family protein
VGKLVSDYKEVFDRLPPKMQETIRMHMIGQVQGTLQAIVDDRFQTLHSRYKLQSVLKQIRDQKRASAIRPLWGSW